MSLTPSAAAKRPPEIVLKIEKPAWRTVYFCFGPDNSHQWTPYRTDAFSFTDPKEAQQIAEAHHGLVVPCDPPAEPKTVPLETHRRHWLPYKDAPDD